MSEKRSKVLVLFPPVIQHASEFSSATSKGPKLKLKNAKSYIAKASKTEALDLCQKRQC